VIRGEPGIGKTALLDYAVAHAGPMKVISARGVEFEAGVPFAGLHELLRPALGSMDRLTPIHAAALRSSLGLGERIEADRLIVGAAVLDLVSAYAEEAPVLLAIDDAQWLDRSSAEAIAFAARRLLADPVAVLVAVREGDGSPLLAAGLPDLVVAGRRMSWSGWSTRPAATPLPCWSWLGPTPTSPPTTTYRSRPVSSGHTCGAPTGCRQARGRSFS